MLPYLSALLAMFSLGGGVLSEAVEWRTYALSPLGLLTLIALGYLAFKCLTRSTRRSLLIALPFSACYAAALVLGANVINGGGGESKRPRYLLYNCCSDPLWGHRFFGCALVFWQNRFQRI